MAVPTYQTTADGIELQFGSNYIGHFLLTKLLLLRILAADKGERIAHVRGMGYELDSVRFDDWNFEACESVQMMEIFHYWRIWFRAESYCVIRPEQRSNKGQIGWQFRHHMIKALRLQRRKVIEGSESQSLQEQSIGYSISTVL